MVEDAVTQFELCRLWGIAGVSSLMMMIWLSAPAKILGAEEPVLSQETQAPALAEDLSQAPADEPVEITGVELTTTSTGLWLTLDTSAELSVLVTTSTIGNALIVEIPNAVLVLPEGDEFQTANPAEGVALVTVSALPDNVVRVALTGVAAPPKAEVQLGATGLVLSIAAGNQVAVDPSTDPSDAEVLEIVVTAQRREENVQDVPISITVLTADDIDDADIVNLEGFAENTPNFSVFSASGSRYFNFYSIRGLSNLNFASRDAVGFYVDDVPYDYGGFITQDFIDLERVEVLRGPQNTLYGRSSQAGVVNIITRRPTDEFEFNGTVGYGAYNGLDLRASASGPIVADQLFFRLAGSYGRRDGYFENILLGNRLDDQSGGNVRGQLLWTPSESWEILLNSSFDDYRDGGAPIVPVSSNPFQVEQDVTGFSDLTTNAQSLRIAYRDSNFQATSITSRRFSRQDIETDLDFSAIRAGRFTNIFDSTVITQEVRLQSPEEDDRFQWLVGGYYESRSFNTANDGFNFDEEAPLLFGAEVVPGSSLLRSADIDETTWAGFGQISYQPVEALTLTAGLRYESVKSSLNRFERIQTTPDGSSFPVLEFNNIQQQGDIFLPRFSVNYRFSPQLVAYGSIARGYRPGGVNFRPDNDASLTFVPERSWNYEAGLKSSWFNNRLGANLAIFHNPISDYQVVILDPFTGLPLGINNADASLTGFELELRGSPVDGFDILAGLGFVDARFTNYQNQATGEVFDDNRLPLAPNLNYNFALQYRAPFGLFARAEIVGLGTTFFDEANTLSQTPYTVINARLGYELENYGIYLFGNNIFDRQYLNFAGGVVGSALGQYGSPATYGIQFRAQF